MIDPAVYARVVKYAAAEEPAATPSTDSDLQHMLKELHFDRDTREGGSNADHTKKLVLADKLQEHGRDLEAAVLRDGHPVKVDGLKMDLSTGVTQWTGGQIKPDHPAFGWPGGTPIYYRHPRSGAVRCPGCMNRTAAERAESLAVGEEPDDFHVHPREFRGYGHEEGPPIECDECNNQIESAYGDPENPDDE